ncbi:hypothetical protein TUM4438_10550 [Shewanella sairae]|uniref:Type II secretion system protein n=1 Tax=Shewanella sairae TaxID=190310 RepID=A0ABQ4P604_9GAMM|nr:type II secretion system protein [Shewanella sairae]MCL1130488.1 type II secretion system GspH family protein [Shewanella sairae]GIU42901.1 hypothetical protein TUM4438_10550 [Shewanella sairae]
MYKKQQGMSLIGVLLSLSLIGVAMIPITQAIGKWSEQRIARHFSEQVENVIDAVQQYHYHKASNRLSVDPIGMWPASLDALISDFGGQFWAQCSMAEANAGRCKRPNHTPFNGQLSYQVVDGLSSLLTVPTGMTGDDKRVWSTALLKIPFSKVKANGDVEIKIAPPLQSHAYAEFLRKDGSTPLTGDWDVGGENAILNTKGLTVRNADGTQMSMGGTVFTKVYEHNSRVDKPICPSHLSPQISAVPMGMFHPTKPLPLIGNGGVFVEDKGAYWLVTLSYAAQIDGGTNWERRHDGNINVTVHCLAQ